MLFSSEYHVFCILCFFFRICIFFHYLISIYSRTMVVKIIKKRFEVKKKYKL